MSMHEYYQITALSILAGRGELASPDLYKAVRERFEVDFKVDYTEKIQAKDGFVTFMRDILGLWGKKGKEVNIGTYHVALDELIDQGCINHRKGPVPAHLTKSRYARKGLEMDFYSITGGGHKKRYDLQQAATSAETAVGVSRPARTIPMPG